MIKIRLQGTTKDIKWFLKILERDKRFMTNEPSRPLDIKGSEKYKRVFTEIYRDKVFFSRITLEDKLGVEYEPFILVCVSIFSFCLHGDFIFIHILVCTFEYILY